MHEPARDHPEACGAKVPRDIDVDGLELVRLRDLDSLTIRPHGDSHRPEHQLRVVASAHGFDHGGGPIGEETGE